MAFPSLVTWLYFVALTRCPAAMQQTAYSVGKCMQFALPALWVLAARRERPAWPFAGRRGLVAGLGFGAAACVALLLGYHAWLGPAGYLAALGPKIAEKTARFGVTGPAGFLVMGAFYSVVHSLLEEYYWRWFVFGRLRQLLPLWPAILLASLAFMAHHVIVLGTYLGWLSPATWLFSLGVALGGAAWCWIYHTSGSLLGPWISHLLVDAAIFLVGYDLARHAAGW
jgi:hypothetical protein